MSATTSNQVVFQKPNCSKLAEKDTIYSVQQQQYDRRASAATSLPRPLGGSVYMNFTGVSLRT
jgi:hypothetical protein